MEPVAYFTIGTSDIDRIQDLWEQLNREHRELSRYFEDWYERFTFTDRKQELLEKGKAGQIRVDLAEDRERCRDVGYCISTVTSRMWGEIDSLFVTKDHRGRGIGTTLVNRALSWLDSAGVAGKSVVVADGNEDAMAFYFRFGFYPRAVVFWQKPRPGNRPK